MRLFVAVELEDAARRAVAREQRSIDETLGHRDRLAFKWVAAEQIHLTLAFLGQVAESRAAFVVDAMGGPFAILPFSLAFGGLGTFPSRGAPRVLWLGIVRGRDEVMNLQREVADRLRKVDIAREDREFHPHLTLGRWRSSRPSDGRRALVSDRGAEVASMKVESVTLFESRLSPSGATHVPLCRARLGAGTSPPLQS